MRNSEKLKRLLARETDRDWKITRYFMNDESLLDEIELWLDDKTKREIIAYLDKKHDYLNEYENQTFRAEGRKH